MRAFRCAPTSIKYSLVVARLSTFELAFFLMSQLAQDDWHCLPYDAAILRSEVFPTKPFMALRDIASARDRLVALGVYLHKRGARKEWLEIAEEYRHARGKNDTSFGENEAPAEQPEEEQEPAQPEAPAQQKELMLGPVCLAKQTGKGRPRKKRQEVPAPVMNNSEVIHNADACGPKFNGLRAEEKIEKDSESARECAGGSAQASATPSPMTQDLNLAIPSGLALPRPSPKLPPRPANVVGAKFERRPDDCDDPLWQRLCNALGLVEMHRCGALWMKRFKLCRDAIAAALSDWEGLKEETRKKYTAAEYMTKAFENEKLRYA